MSNDVGVRCWSLTTLYIFWPNHRPTEIRHRRHKFQDLLQSSDSRNIVTMIIFHSPALNIHGGRTVQRRHVPSEVATWDRSAT